MMNPRNAIMQAVGNTFSAANKVAPFLSMAYAGYQFYNVVQPLVSTYFNRQSPHQDGDDDDDDEIHELVVSPRTRPRRNVPNRCPGDQQQPTATSNRDDDREVELINEIGASERYTVANDTTASDVEIIDEIPGTREIDAIVQERLREDSEPQPGPSRLGYTTPARRIVFVDDMDESEQTELTHTNLPDDNSLSSHTGEGGLDLDSELLCQICGRFLHHAEKEIAALPFCDHLFHEKCIEGVMAFNQRCPKCASSIFCPI